MTAKEIFINLLGSAGGMSIKNLASYSGVPRIEAWRHIEKMKRENLVTWLTHRRWGLTPSGREVFEDMRRQMKLF